jgi:hypothetical protein
MMNFASILRILSPLLVLGVAFSQIVIDHIWHDKRTKKYRRTRSVLISILVIMTLFTMFIVYQSEKDNVDLKKSLKNIEQLVENLKSENITIAKQSEKLEFEAKNERASLEKKINSIEVKLEPFINVAKTTYPGINIDNALKKLLNDIDSLKEKTSGLENKLKPRNISETDLMRLIAMLKEGAGQKVKVEAAMGDAEAKKLAKVLRYAFKQAGWDTKIFAYFSGITIEGIWVSSSAPKTKEANLIQKALSEIGLESQWWRHNNNSDTTDVSVGAKRLN